jgi:hypothetical protein
MTDGSASRRSQSDQSAQPGLLLFQRKLGGWHDAQIVRLFSLVENVRTRPLCEHPSFISGELRGDLYEMSFGLRRFSSEEVRTMHLAALDAG